MLNPPFRGPNVKLAGLVHFARLLDKIRLHAAGDLPEEYHPNLGLSHGLDGHLCGFLGVDFTALCERVRQGGEDAAIAEWCFQTGLRPNKVQMRVWNEFARKLGWNDFSTKYIESVKMQDGIQDRAELQTAFDAINYREGRFASPPP